MAKELGSEFWNVPTASAESGVFPQSTQWYLSGRSALQAIIAELNDIKTVAMPSWCCDSMVKPFADAGIKVDFYPVYLQQGLVQEINTDCDALFLMDYFGFSSDAPKLSEYKGIVIRDITHSVFSAVYNDAQYYFGSLRKWCGVLTGGYARTKDGHALIAGNADASDYTGLRAEAMRLKDCYISGTADTSGNIVCDKKYLKIFDSAEDILENIGIAPAAENDVYLARLLDVDFIVSRRRANARILMDAFSDWLIFKKLRDTDCPMFVPVIVPDNERNALRRFLISRDIYCPVHWPVSKYHRLNENERRLYDNELSLVCDQRYTEEDMRYMVDTIKAFRKEWQ